MLLHLIVTSASVITCLTKTWRCGLQRPFNINICMPYYVANKCGFSAAICRELILTDTFNTLPMLSIMFVLFKKIPEDNST